MTKSFGGRRILDGLDLEGVDRIADRIVVVPDGIARAWSANLARV